MHSLAFINLTLQRTEERYAQRKMKLDYSTNIQINDWKKDKFLLQYLRKFENWEIFHVGLTEVIKFHVYSIYVGNYMCACLASSK